MSIPRFLQAFTAPQWSPSPVRQRSGRGGAARSQSATPEPLEREAACDCLPPTEDLARATAPRQALPTLLPEAPSEVTKQSGRRNPVARKPETCVICFEAPGGVKLQPCGHNQFCQACARQVRKCPLCRAHMTSWKDGRTTCVFGTPVWV
eukprot:CAMPEP_0194517034 /NCGR_PEP_ID=MMETSP0253-20130528/50094_1 /TAXON_ID=2966 /ORGANISM="Noctiluca scintillans" /LENGTH=149 /DNA_ID=CAMNT_0039360951 /DNA_START=9 /DNA_END=458 /DNA_ORIENTATION=+